MEINLVNLCASRALACLFDPVHGVAFIYCELIPSRVVFSCVEQTIRPDRCQALRQLAKPRKMPQAQVFPLQEQQRSGDGGSGNALRSRRHRDLHRSMVSWRCICCGYYNADENGESGGFFCFLERRIYARYAGMPAEVGWRNHIAAGCTKTMAHRR